jgi:hypothetical protein
MTPKPEGHMASYIGRRELLAALGSAAVGWPRVALDAGDGVTPSRQQ